MKAVIHTHLAMEYPDLVNRVKLDLDKTRITVTETLEDMMEELGGAEVLLYGRPDEAVLDAGKLLKAVIIPYTGVNRFEMSWFRKRGLLLGNSHGNAAIVAERAVGLAMAVCGRIPEFHNDLTRGDWHGTDDPVHPFDNWLSLQGKKVSILGTGAIGSHIAGLLTGFNMEIMGFRLHAAEKLPGFVSVTGNVDEALSFGDIIFLALPLTEKTRHSLDGKRLEKMKGKYIINVARGELIEEKAFFECLKDGILAGAGIDAWYTYPREGDPVRTGSRYPFHTLPNVVVSPHAASHTEEGEMGQFRGALDNLRHYVKTGRLLYSVNLGEGY